MNIMQAKYEVTMTIKVNGEWVETIGVDFEEPKWGAQPVTDCYHRLRHVLTEKHGVKFNDPA